jgi:hypothetical protein
MTAPLLSRPCVLSGMLPGNVVRDCVSVSIGIGVLSVHYAGVETAEHSLPSDLSLRVAPTTSGRRYLREGRREIGEPGAPERVGGAHAPSPAEADLPPR